MRSSGRILTTELHEPQEGPAETTVLVRAIVDASRCRGLELRRIWFDPDIGRRLLREHGDRHEGTRFEADDRLRGRIEI